MSRAPAPGRIVAAALGAPAAALLFSVALPALVPASREARYLVAVSLVVPLMAGAPCLALLARSTRRAWAGIAVTATASLLVLWRAAP